MRIHRQSLLAIAAICITSYLAGCSNGSNNDSASNSSGSTSNTGWEIVDLGVLTGDSYSAAYDINDSGAVVGESGNVSGGQSGFYWQSGTIEPALGFGSDIANSINNQGLVAGVYFILGGNYGFIREKNGAFSFVAWPQNWSQSALYSINNVGHAAGTGYVNWPSRGHRGFFFDGTTTIPIEPLAGDFTTWAIAINDSDTITGYSTSDPNQPVGRGFIFSGGNIIEIGFLPGSNNSYPQAINNRGDVVGSSGGQAFLYSNGTIQPLGYLPGDSYSVAHGINDQGDIVGRSGNRAFLFRNGIMIDLSALSDVQQSDWSSLYEARSINNIGQIVGQGFRNDFPHAFLLSPK